MNKSGNNEAKYVASLSYGKDSLYMLEVIHEYNLPLDEIVTVDVWATDTIPAELPPVEDFKKKADEIILKRYGKKVKHLRSKESFESMFYRKHKKGKSVGKIYGFPCILGAWCNSILKTSVLNKIKGKSYIGYAIDEKNAKRQQKIKEYLNGNQNNKLLYPLCDYNKTEEEAMKWCKENDLLSPTYLSGNRGGCWFCANQSEKQLRELRRYYPEYWALLQKWDKDSPRTFKVGNITIDYYNQKFRLEESRKLVSKNMRRINSRSDTDE